MIEEREYNEQGNDCVFYNKKILTRLDDKYIVLEMHFCRGWGANENIYDKQEFDTEKQARKYFEEN